MTVELRLIGKPDEIQQTEDAIRSVLKISGGRRYPSRRSDDELRYFKVSIGESEPKANVIRHLQRVDALDVRMDDLGGKNHVFIAMDFAAPGYDWYDPATGTGLYNIFSRTSCWLCPLQRIGELRKLYTYYPDLWEKLGRMESDLKATRESEGMPFNTWKYKADASWEQLNARFQAEEKAVSSQKTIEVFI